MRHDEHSDARERMIRGQLQARGVVDSRVLEAFRAVPRERFVRPGDEDRAYADHALVIGHQQTISQPYMVGVMTAFLGLTGSERVLEVGTGSGYQCAVLAELSREVWSVERIPELADAARRTLGDLGYTHVQVVTGDGSLGWEEAAPYDAIVVTAAAPAPPTALLHQLSPEGGRLVVPVGNRDLQHLVRIERQGTAFTTERTLGCRFVPLLGEEGWTEEA